MERRTHRLQGSGKLRANWFIFVAGGWPDRRSELQKKIGPYCFQGGPRFEFHRFGGSFRSSGTPAPGGANNSWLPPAPPHSAEPAEVAIWAKVVAYVCTLLLHRPCIVAFHQALAGHALTLRLLPLPSPRAHHDPHGAGHDARGAVVGDARAAAGAAGSAWRCSPLIFLTEVGVHGHALGRAAGPERRVHSSVKLAVRVRC